MENEINIVIPMDETIGHGYPTGTGRLIEVNTDHDPLIHKRVALIGDSTIENGHWVDPSQPYCKKIHTVPFQIAVALRSIESTSFRIANFAVDGFTSSDVLRYTWMDSVLRTDPDHPAQMVSALDAAASWKPDTVVLSVGGNDYRVALTRTLHRLMPISRLLLRLTPPIAKETIHSEFLSHKEMLIENYKAILERLIAENPHLQRIIISTQYYPALTSFTPYHIYTGFSHIGRSEAVATDSFTSIHNTMQEIYHEIVRDFSNINKEIIFLDMTSSLNPLGGYHSFQIEPNAQGSEVMGQLIAKAVTHHFDPLDHTVDKKIIMRLWPDEKSIETFPLNTMINTTYQMRTLPDFISHSRYRHLLPAPYTSLSKRMEHTYYFFAGRRFDAQYTGLFAFGFSDLSLITIAASYLWRYCMYNTNSRLIFFSAGILSASVLLIQWIASVVLTAAAFPIILLFHCCMRPYVKKENKKNPVISTDYSRKK